jgi:hypothetical protein
MFNDNLANQPGMFHSKQTGGMRLKNTQKRRRTGKQTKNNGKTKKNTNKKTTKKKKKNCGICGKMKGMF